MRYDGEVRLVALVLVTGCRLAFDDLGRESTLDASPDVATSDDVLATTPQRAVQATTVLAIDAFAANTLTFPQPTVAGNTIVVFTWTWSSQGLCLLAPSDSVGNTYTQARIASISGSCALGYGEVALHVAPVTTASATHKITLNRTAGDNTAQYTMFAVEYEGLSASPLVAADSTITSDVSPLTFSAGTVTTTEPALLVSAVTICGGYPDDAPWTAPGLSIRGMEMRTNNLAPGAGGDMLVTTNGEHTQNWSVTFTGGTSVPVIGVAAALR